MNKLLKDISIHKSWNGIEQYVSEYTSTIVNRLDNDFNPSFEHVLRFLQVDLSNIKVVILGQDPYPRKNVATGRAFEVAGLASWCDTFRQSSLKNILRLLYYSYCGEVLIYSELREKIQNGSFNILAPNKLFATWEERGVLLLNVYLTCAINRPRSHRMLWEGFMPAIFKYIGKTTPDVRWFLWGNEAIKMSNHIERSKQIFRCNHPMICNISNESDFINSKCFVDTKQIINWIN